MPASDSVDGHGRKPKKGKAEANNDYEPAEGYKRKHRMKSVSATPDVDDDEDDHDTVSNRKQNVFNKLTYPVLESTTNRSSVILDGRGRVPRGSSFKNQR